MASNPVLRRARERSNMRHVAERAGVAVSSVSRVLSGHPDVSDSMREKVMNAVAELGYHPDLLAQSMRWRATLTCGFIVNDIANPLFAEMVKGAERALEASGYSMLLTNSEGNPERDIKAIQLLEQRRVDGLLISLASETHGPTLDVLRSLDVPTVLIDRDVPDDVPAARVMSDHAVGVRAAVEHLVGEGHRRIAIIVGDRLRPSNERARAFAEALREHADGLVGEVMRVPYSPEHGARAARELLAREDPPSALLVGGNQFLLGALETVSAIGLRLGRDLALVGCDDTPLTRLHDPPISVIARDIGEMGRTAADVLLRSLGGAELTPEPVVLPTVFAPRASTGLAQLSR
jgi:LacI family transcriptional regulator